jgi:hypothetical protein
MSRHLRRLIAGLHQERAALVALRDRARPEQRWQHEAEIEDVDARLANVRALEVTPEDEARERLRAACGGDEPRELRDVERAMPAGRRGDRRMPAGRARVPQAPFT